MNTLKLTQRPAEILISYLHSDKERLSEMRGMGVLGRSPVDSTSRTAPKIDVIIVTYSFQI